MIARDASAKSLANTRPEFILTESRSVGIELSKGNHGRRCGITGSFRFQMLIKPVGEADDVQKHRRPAVPLPGADLEADFAAQFLGLGDESLGLINRHQRVGIAMHNHGRRHLWSDVVDR